MPWRLFASHADFEMDDLSLRRPNLRQTRRPPQEHRPPPGRRRSLKRGAVSVRSRPKLHRTPRRGMRRRSLPFRSPATARVFRRPSPTGPDWFRGHGCWWSASSWQANPAVGALPSSRRSRGSVHRRCSRTSRVTSLAVQRSPVFHPTTIQDVGLSGIHQLTR